MYTVFGPQDSNEIEWGGEIFRPITRWDKVIPDYFVSYAGHILSLRTSNPKLLNPQYKTVKGKSYVDPRFIGARIPKDFFEDYQYASAECPGKGTVSCNIKIHRAVMDAWKPIDEFPPIPMEEWIKTPEAAKQFIRESAIIDHIDGNTENNHADNLRWCTPRQNNVHWKLAEAA